MRDFFISLYFVFSFITINDSVAQEINVNDTLSKEAIFYNDLSFDKYDLGEIDSCLFYLDTAAIIAEKAKNWDLLTTISSNSFSFNYRLGNYETAEKNILTSKRILEEFINPTSETYAQTCNELGVYYKEKADYETALSYYYKIITMDSIYNRYWVRAMKSSQSIYTIISDFEKAMDCQNKVKEFIDNSNVNYQHLKPELYYSLASIYKGKLQKDSAQVYFLKSKQILDTIDYKGRLGLKRYQVENIMNLIEFSLEKDNIGLDTEKLLGDFEKIYEEEYFYKKHEFFLKKSLFNSSKGNNLLALQNIEKAKKEAKIIYKSFKNHAALAKGYEYAAKIFFKQKKYSDALKELDEGFGYASIINQKDATFNGYYPPKSILNKKQGLRFLKLKAQVYEQLFIETNKIGELKDAANTYNNLSDLILSFRERIQSQSSELIWSQRLNEIYQSAVKNAVTLYQKTNEKKYLEQAFYYSECNKAATLAEKVSYEKTIKSILPKDKWKALQDLRIDIAFYQKQINSARQKTEQDSTKIAEWTQIIEDLENEYEASEKEIKDSYPEYAAAVKTFKPSTVEDIRNGFLKDNTALVEYFSTEDSWYIFTLTKDDLTVEEVKQEESLDIAFDGLIKQISQQPNSSTYVQGLTEFADNSHALYKFLLKNSLQNLPKEINSLMIIPDGELTYFPFELLLSEKPNQDANTAYSASVMPYLFNNYNISYGFSATVVNLTHKNIQQKKSGKSAIFAPTFSSEYIAENRSCQEDNLSYLQCNTTEGERINNLISGDIFTGDLASIQQFREVAANSPILHLATHACVDEENTDGNKIFFADTYLTNEDLNTLGVNADLVVLSACDTGLGKLIKGEGLMSLSRGFLCAGAASTVMSLWSVDDCATSDLMVSFYQELKGGRDKATALKNAKLNYLAQADKLHQHPYFWAPFVLSGNVEPIETLSTGSNFLYLGIGAMALLFLIFFGYKKMKSQN